MSNTTNNPIRVADLSESVYIPRVQAKTTTSFFPNPKKQHASNCLSESDAQYVWNAPAEETGLQTESPPVPPQSKNTSVSLAPLVPLAVTEPYRPMPVKRDLSIALHTDPATEVFLSAQLPTKTQDAISLATLDAPATPVAESSLELKLAELKLITELHEPKKVENARGFEELCDLLEQPAYEPVELPLPPQTAHVWGLDYHSISMAETLDYLEQVILADCNSYAVTANLNYAMLCDKHPRLQAFTKRAALVLCDGMPALWRSKLGSIQLPERVTGADLIYRLSERCAEKSLRVYFYGAAEGIAEKAAAKLQQLYPKLIVAGVQCPPFHDSSSQQIQNQIARIRKAKPHVLFVALGQPKGEYWIEDHLSELDVPLSIQLGASFDFVAGNNKRAPKWMQKLGLEWLYRTAHDPRRLAPRYLHNLVFLVRAVRRELIDSLS